MRYAYVENQLRLPLLNVPPPVRGSGLSWQAVLYLWSQPAQSSLMRES